jgi:hypothetical protein
VPRVFAQQIASHQRKVTAMQTDLIEHMVVNDTREGKAACGRRPRKSIHQLASHFRDNSGRLANECSRSKNLCFPARSNTSNFNARTDFPDMGTIGVHKMSAVAHNARITALRAPVALGSAPVLRPVGELFRLLNLVYFLREGPCSHGASWGVCGSGVPPYDFLNLYGVFNSRFC